MGALATVHVGGLPQFAAYDAADGDVYVPNWANSNVSVVNGTHVVATVPAGGIPFSATYDPTNHFVYIVNNASNNVTVINGTAVVGNVKVGTTPTFASYDSSNQELYVSNYGSANVSVINGTAVVATLKVGTHPSAPVVSYSTSCGGGGGGWVPRAGPAPAVCPTPLIFVPNSGSNNVTVFGGAMGLTFLGSTHVGSQPQFATWDPSNVWLYVANRGSANVSVLSDVAPFNVLYTIAVGNGPFSTWYDAVTNEVWVANSNSSSLSLLGGALTNTVIATVKVGSGPEFIAQDPSFSNELLVPNTGSGNISVISGTTVVNSITAGSFPVVGTYDPADKEVYVQNFDSATLTVVGPSDGLSFKAKGLPAGSSWSVAITAPSSQSGSNTTVGTTGEITFAVTTGTVTFAITSPALYAPAKITGPGNPSLTSGPVTTSQVWTVTFGALRSLFFNESVAGFQLANGSPWTVYLNASLPHGGPPNQVKSTTVNGSAGTFLAFTVPSTAAYKFSIVGPTDYRAAPPHGGASVPATHTSFTKLVKFKLDTSVIRFHETGLTGVFSWNVKITASSNAAVAVGTNITKTTATIVFHLPSGTYSWTATSGANTMSGSITVAFPTAQTVTVTL